mmetsp:Transcript_37965/g.61743  ORF Transcript_37965/g.61743 Transcript_37965/m.61743 type:complete len:507 (+) Transcript_37965:304-1824(+)
MKISLAVYLATCCFFTVSEGVNTTSPQSCEDFYVEAKQEYPITNPMEDYDFAQYADHIGTINLAITGGQYFIAGLVLAFIDTTAPILAGVLLAVTFVVGGLIRPNVDYSKLIAKFREQLEVSMVEEHLESCTAAYHSFHVFLKDIRDCTDSERTVLDLMDNVNTLLSTCDIDGSWGQKAKLHGLLASNDNAGCADFTKGKCRELAPLLNNAVLMSINLVDDVYDRVEERLKDVMDKFRSTLNAYTDHLQSPQTAAVWHESMNNHSKIDCRVNRICLFYMPPHDFCGRFEYEIAKGSYYSYDWGTKIVEFPAGKVLANFHCESSEMYTRAVETSTKFNMAKVEHLTQPLFSARPRRFNAGRGLSHGCSDLGWGEICRINSSGSWERSTCQHIRHNEFCEATPGCMLENHKCVTIPPETYQTCWLKGLPEGSNSRPGCQMLSKHTKLGCSWINGWGCKQGLDAGEVVGNKICRSDFKPCLKDWSSNGTKWAVCAKERDCVKTYRGKVL